uniref:uncharacterized protein LOC131140718 isoform X2 n=1 Tax=Doryrhamphus excisus TaxID=161450 RepID=UPI0025ADD1E5|nr:uncharacterized protein LOC131140718 isoform X2 [Doryrhamphus excisus]
MATSPKKRSAYFTPSELEILTQSYGAFEHIFKRKSNTVAAVKERVAAWQKIADRVNACNPSSQKRTWAQLKMKYKNLIQSANRKKAEGRKMSGEPALAPIPTPPLKEEEEELVLCQGTGRPVVDGIPGGISSQPLTIQDTSAFVKYSNAVICLVEPNAVTELVVDGDAKDTMEATIEWDPSPDDIVKDTEPTTIEWDTSQEETFKDTESVPIEWDTSQDESVKHVVSATPEWDPEPPPEESMVRQQKVNPSASTAKLDTLPVKTVYKMHLLKKMEKTDKEMTYLDLQMKKTDLEIEILKYKLEVGEQSQVN